MTPVAALTVREIPVPVATRALAGPRRGRAGVLALLAATVVVRSLRPDRIDVLDRAVAWSGSQSWKAWFFGTLDPQAATSVGAPAAGWLSGLVLRISASADLAVLATVLAVLAVAVLTVTVRRIAGPSAGLVAGAVLALLLRSGDEAQTALLLGVTGYLLVRHRGSARWSLGAGLAGGGAVLVGGWGAALGVALLVGTLLLRWTPRHRAVLDVAVLTGTAAACVGVWFVVAPGWPGGPPVSSGVWIGPGAGVLAPLAATALALGGTWLWRRWRGAPRVVLVLALVLSAGLGAGARAHDASTIPADTSTTSLLQAAGTTWSAATVASPQDAATLELASGTAVLALRTGDATVSLTQFQSYVATGRVRYLLVPDGSRSAATSDVVAWAAAAHTAMTVGTTTVYDLSD
ncbi:hypothetical protein OG218_12765 [Kineococcus sp. NBC_00420]|uniref:hypothetical protein n=1 Tax=Kineococcus sp. NBC_00420 TaxID=2903564 RepID=UPI002E1CB3BF